MAYGTPVIGTDSVPVGAGKVNDSLDALKTTSDDHETRIDTLEGGGGTVPDATTTVKGKVELATNAETVTGTDTARATTPAGVAALAAAVLTTAASDAAAATKSADTIADGTTNKAYTATEKTKLAGVAAGATKDFLWWKPSDNALIGASFPPHGCIAVTLMVSGAYYLARVHVPAGSAITNVLSQITVAGAGLTAAEVAVYEQNGTRVGVSASQTTAWQSIGTKTTPLTSPIAAQSTDRDVWVSFLADGTTKPTFSTCGSLSNLGLGAGRQNGGYILGAAPHPSSLTLTSTVASVCFWAGLS